MTDRAALAAKLRWAYPRGPTHVTQEEWRIVLAALEAAPDRETRAIAALQGIATNSCCFGCREAALVAQEALACLAPRSDADAPRAPAPVPSEDRPNYPFGGRFHAEPSDEAVVGLQLDGAGGPQASVTLSENRGVYFLHAVYATREEADAALARLSADVPTDEEVARELVRAEGADPDDTSRPRYLSGASLLSDALATVRAVNAARDRAKGSG